MHTCWPPTLPGHVDVQQEFVDKIPQTLICLTDKSREAFEAYRQSLTQVLEDPTG